MADWAAGGLGPSGSERETAVALAWLRQAPMRRDRIIVLVKYEAIAGLTRRICEQSRLGWEDAIEISSIPERRRSASNDEATDLMIRRWFDGEYSRLICQKDLALDLDRIKSQLIPSNVVSTVDDAFDKVNRELKRRRLHWLTSAQYNFDNSTNKYLPPDAWVKQFADLGHEWIGRILLKQLRVVSDSELRDAFTVLPKDVEGHRVFYGYFGDSEAGSSSISIRNILEHLKKYGDVVEVNASELLQRDFRAFDSIYIFEDGLWSGVELVDRLSILRDRLVGDLNRIQFQFVFGVTSDAGLIAGRSYLRQQGISNVVLRSSVIENHYCFLPNEFKREISHRVEISSDEIRKLIDESVNPQVFQSDSLWNGQAVAARRFCSEVGAQLVRPFLERREAMKAEQEARSPRVVGDDKVGRWALGALNFGSPVVFASSSPKPSLPLLWLSGQVSIGGRTISWRPLFWDTRRTGAEPSK